MIGRPTNSGRKGRWNMEERFPTRAGPGSVTRWKCCFCGERGRVRQPPANVGSHGRMRPVRREGDRNGTDPGYGAGAGFEAVAWAAAVHGDVADEYAGAGGVSQRTGVGEPGAGGGGARAGAGAGYVGGLCQPGALAGRHSLDRTDCPGRGLGPGRVADGVPGVFAGGTVGPAGSVARIAGGVPVFGGVAGR